MAESTDERFEAVYGRLRGILETYARKMYVSADSDSWYGFDLAPEAERVPATWFGAVRRGLATAAIPERGSTGAVPERVLQPEPASPRGDVEENQHHEQAQPHGRSGVG